MTSVRRSPPRGPAGDSEDPTLQELGIDAAGSVAVKEQAEAGPVEEPNRSFAERFTDWRRHYVPLPDEVVTEYLGEDEYVIHTDHPSFRAFLIQNMVQVLIATALLPIVFAFVRMDLEWWWILLIVLGLDLVLLVLAVRRLSDRYTSYVITNLRLIRMSGIIGRKLASIPWTRMTGLGFRQKPIGRLMGFATIFIESANEESGLREFSDINDPSTFHQMILDMVSSKGGPKPDAPTKGVRKTLRQRRREAKDALRKASEAPVAEAVEDEKPETEIKAEAETPVEAPAKPATKPDTKPVTVVDTAGPAEAMSTSEGVRAPKPPTATPPPAAARRRPAVTPPSGTPVTKPPRADRPGTPPPRTERPAASQQPAPERPVPPSRSRPAGSRPAARPGPGAPRPTGPVPATPSRQRLAGPRPARPASEPTGTPNRAPHWAWPGGQGGSESPRDQRTGRVAPERSAEPIIDRIKRAASPLADRLKGGGKGPGGSSIDPAKEPLVERVSARDAIAAVRRGRSGRPVRRPRFPSFGRARPAIPPSRQLPAASSNPRSRRRTDDDGNPGDS